MNKEKIRFYSHLTVTVLGALILAYISVKYLLALVLPFLLAWGVAFSIRPIAKKISDGTKIPDRIISVILTALIVIGGIAVIVSVAVYAFGEAWNFISSLADDEALYDVLDRIMNPIKGLVGDREGGEELEAHIGEAVSSMISSLLSGAVSAVGAFVRSVPRVLIFILITVIASIYFSLELEKINGFVKKILPKSVTRVLVNFKNKFLSSLLKYLRAYLIIMLITFIIMLFGFLIIGVKYAVLLAFIVALLDALPLIGVGTVLVPWSIYQLIFSDVRVGIGLMILFGAQAVLREFIEPKIIGKNLGIHPIVSLFLLYAGYIVFGFMGLFLIPLVSVIVNILINKDNSSEVG